MLESIPAVHPHMADFRRAAQQAFWHPSTSPLRNIVAVGADYSAEKGLDLRDGLWLMSALQFCRKSKIPVPKDFSFTPLNMTKGDDILNPALRAPMDMLLCCYIVNPERFSAAELKEKRERHGAMFNVSPYHSKTAWAEAADRNKPGLIITFNQLHEINGSHFVTAPGYVRGPTDMVVLQDGKQAVGFFMETVFREDLMQEYSKPKSTLQKIFG